jgi:hypothetical protein
VGRGRTRRRHPSRRIDQRNGDVPVEPWVMRRLSDGRTGAQVRVPPEQRMVDRRILGWAAVALTVAFAAAAAAVYGLAPHSSPSAPDAKEATGSELLVTWRHRDGARHGLGNGDLRFGGARLMRTVTWEEDSGTASGKAHVRLGEASSQPRPGAAQ